MNEASTTIYLNIPITQTELQGLPPADRFTHVGSTPLLSLYQVEICHDFVIWTTGRFIEENAVTLWLPEGGT